MAYNATHREAQRIAAADQFTEEELRVIKAAQRDYWTFLNTVYAASFKDLNYLGSNGEYRDFTLGGIHQLWSRIVGGAVDADGNQTSVPYKRWRIKAPRLHLKSTVVGRGYLFWRFFSEGEDVDAFYFGYKKPLADEHVTLLKQDILKNPYCRFWTDNNSTATSIIDFTVSFRETKEAPDRPEVKTWRAQAEGEGILSATRGRHPKIVLCDDILSDFANPIESVEIDRINQVFDFVIMNLPPADGTLGVIGTPQSPTDVLAKLESNPVFYCGEYPAVKSYAEEKTLWPEMYDYRRLMVIKKQIGDSAFEVEYQLKPRQSVDQFLSSESLGTCVDNSIQRYEPVEGEVFPNPDKLALYGGMDVGKEIHPSHITMFIEMPPEPGQDQGWLVQVYEKWLDGMNYNDQVALVNEVMRYFNPTRFHFDSTRSELDDRGLTKRASGVKFKKNLKASMATGLEKRVVNSWMTAKGDPLAGPGIVLFGPENSRQIRSLKQMRKDFTATENEDGHGDCFISTMLAVWSCDTGPRWHALGDVQSIFGGRAGQRRGGRDIFCEHEYVEFTLDDPLGPGVRPSQRWRKCRHCGTREQLP